MFFPLRGVASVDVFTDASGFFGCGGVLMSSHWFNFAWPEFWATVDISVKELVPVVVAAALWGRFWYRTHVCFHSDNTAVVAMLTSGTGSTPAAQHLLRCLYFYTALFQFDYTAEHVPGVENVAADALSRNNIVLFSSLIKQASRTQIPTVLVELLVTRQPDWGSPTWTRLFTSTLPRR